MWADWCLWAYRDRLGIDGVGEGEGGQIGVAVIWALWTKAVGGSTGRGGEEGRGVEVPPRQDGGGWGGLEREKVRRGESGESGERREEEGER